MHKIFYVTAFLLISFIGKSQTIKVVINGIENDKGNIEIGLYNSKEGFTEYDKRCNGATVNSSKDSVTYTFENIPEGEYAIAAFHDENKNKKIDKNWIGIPTESYGFSLNKYGSFGPPNFEKVAFSLKSGETKELKITFK